MNAIKNMHQTPSPVTLIPDHPGIKSGIALYLKRDDMLHPTIQGNKWRKLAPIISTLHTGAFRGILTFGGPFSNHIHAVAAAGKAYGFPTAAIIRGLSADLDNPTLQYAQACGMQLLPVSKKDYDAGMHSDILRQITAPFSAYLTLPEGGATADAIRSCAAISSEIIGQTPDVPASKRFIAVPAGTGTTAAGIIGGLKDSGQVLVFPAAMYGVSIARIQTEVKAVFGEPIPAFQYLRDYIFGEFASFHPELIAFVRTFLSRTGILLDPIYSSRMMWGVYDLLTRGHFPEGSVVTAVHTGGLQGWDGFQRRFGIDIRSPDL